MKLSNCTLPLDCHLICLYIQYLSRSLKSPQSIRNYISGIKTLHLLLNLPFPDLKDLSVRLTLLGIDKSLSHIPQPAQPMTVEILLKLYHILDLSVEQNLVLWGLFLFSFFTFSRKSQFIPVDLSPSELSHLVKRQDIECHEDIVKVTLLWTKTHQTGGAPLVIPLASIPGSPLCPVSTYRRMVTVVKVPPSFPAFVVYNNVRGYKPILYREFHVLLRNLLSLVGCDPARFSSHSFRRGGTTFAFKVGVPSQLIKVQGDWKSDCFQRYIECDYNDRLQVAHSLSRHVTRLTTLY